VRATHVAKGALDLEHFGSELTVVYCELLFSAHSLFTA
jgi:hypothetical protein